MPFDFARAYSVSNNLKVLIFALFKNAIVQNETLALRIPKTEPVPPQNQYCETSLGQILAESKSSFKIGKKMLNKSKYYIISTMMVTIFAQTDKIMLKMMLDNSSVGYYTAGITCATMFAFVFAAILDSFRPTVFEAKKKSNEAFQEQMKKLYSILIYFSLLICLLSTIFSPLIIKIMYGKEYSLAIPVLRVVVWYTTFSYLGSARNIWVMAEEKQKYLWIMNLSGAIINIILNLILIPVYNIVGAAIASLITQIFTNIIIGFIIKPIRENNKLMIQALDIRNLKNIFFSQ